MFYQNNLTTLAPIAIAICVCILTAIVVLRYIGNGGGRRFNRWRGRIILRLSDVEEQLIAVNKKVFPDQYKDLENELRQFAHETEAEKIFRTSSGTYGNNEATAIITSVEGNGIDQDLIECGRCHIKFDVDKKFGVYYCPGCGSKFTDYKDSDAAINSGKGVQQRKGGGEV